MRTYGNEGLLSPPRSKFSPKMNGSQTAARKTAPNPNHGPSKLKESHTKVKANASATSPPRIRGPPKASRALRNAPGDPNASKPTSTIIPSRRPNPNDLHAGSKATAKTTFPAKPSQPRGATPLKAGYKAEIDGDNIVESPTTKDRSPDLPLHLNEWKEAQTYDNELIDNQVDKGTLIQSPEKRSGATSSQTPLPDTDLIDTIVYVNERGSRNNNGARIFQIYMDIASHRQGSLSITSYLTKLTTFWNELASYTDLPTCSCGAMTKHEEREKVMQFLGGLNDSYSTLRGQILLMEPFPTIERSCSLILREEKRRELVSSLETVAEKLLNNSRHPNDHIPNDQTLLSNEILSKNSASGDLNSTPSSVHEKIIKGCDEVDGFTKALSEARFTEMRSKLTVIRSREGVEASGVSC